MAAAAYDFYQVSLVPSPFSSEVIVVEPNGSARFRVLREECDLVLRRRESKEVVKPERPRRGAAREMAGTAA